MRALYWLMLAIPLAVLSGTQTAAAHPDCATADEVKALKDRVEKLEQKSGEAPVVDEEAEKVAAKLLNGINTALGAGDIATAKQKLARLKSSYPSTAAYKRARRYESELAVVGKDAPTTLEVDRWLSNRTEIDLTSDRPTLIVFWEQWCPHSKREVPKLEATYQRHRGLQMIAVTKVTRSATEDKVVEFVIENNLSFPFATEIIEDGKGTLSTHFNVRGVPAAALIKGGKIIWRGHPGRLNDDLLNTALVTIPSSTTDSVEGLVDEFIDLLEPDIAVEEKDSTPTVTSMVGTHSIDNHGRDGVHGTLIIKDIGGGRISIDLDSSYLLGEFDYAACSLKGEGIWRGRSNVVASDFKGGSCTWDLVRDEKEFWLNPTVPVKDDEDPCWLDCGPGYVDLDRIRFPLPAPSAAKRKAKEDEDFDLDDILNRDH